MHPQLQRDKMPYFSRNEVGVVGTSSVAWVVVGSGGGSGGSSRSGGLKAPVVLLG